MLDQKIIKSKSTIVSYTLECPSWLQVSKYIGFFCHCILSQVHISAELFSLTDVSNAMLFSIFVRENKLLDWLRFWWWGGQKGLWNYSRTGTSMGSSSLIAGISLFSMWLLLFFCLLVTILIYRDDLWADICQWAIFATLSSNIFLQFENFKKIIFTIFL